ncbi:MAG: hypothetical protein K2O66_01765, partial [Bacteroidales bacterium]|nr:hypothetical protein [Bacteroidales bacterium]
EHIGGEVALGHKINARVNKLEQAEQLRLVSFENGLATYSAQIFLDGAGVFDYAFRIYPRNDRFPTPNRFRMTRWF